MFWIFYIGGFLATYVAGHIAWWLAGREWRNINIAWVMLWWFCMLMPILNLFAPMFYIFFGASESKMTFNEVAAGLRHGLDKLLAKLKRNKA